MLFKTGDKLPITVEVIEVDDVEQSPAYHLRVGNTNEGFMVPAECFEQAAQTADPQVIVKIKQKELEDVLAKVEQLQNEIRELEEGEGN